MSNPNPRFPSSPPGGPTAGWSAHSVSSQARTKKYKLNPLYPIVIEIKPTAHECHCNICDGKIEKGDIRAKIIMEQYRYSSTYYFHIHCFLDSLMGVLKKHGYDTTAYVAGRLFE